MKKLFYILSLLFLFACSGSQTKPSMYLTQGPRTTMERIVDTFEMRLVDKAGISAIVLTFTDISGKVHPDGDLLAEKLSTELAKREKITILDRLVFQKKLEENSLDLKGGADLNKIKKIGKVLEVDYVVIGLMSSY
ncbi:MAG: hypothetical protein KDK45_18680, partial [Leptospiraceae bacterium]|nr:hypothetical protein [Leptospiraceae bacterium]